MPSESTRTGVAPIALAMRTRVAFASASRFSVCACASTRASSVYSVASDGKTVLPLRASSSAPFVSFAVTRASARSTLLATPAQPASPTATAAVHTTAAARKPAVLDEPILTPDLRSEVAPPDDRARFDQRAPQESDLRHRTERALHADRVIQSAEEG